MRMVMEVSDRILVLNYGRPHRRRAGRTRSASDAAVIEAYLGQGSAARQAGRAAANA